MPASYGQSYGQRAAPAPQLPPSGRPAPGVVGTLQGLALGLVSRIQRGGGAPLTQRGVPSVAPRTQPTSLLGAQARGSRAMSRIQRPGSHAKLGAPGVDEMRGTLHFKRR
ncbi:MAG TPA: hypothetical protein VMV29_24140 [Ktedonobacterales bacterium]|nr:hypothetical protein [Ktedonobacterales bacterium]